MMGKSWRRCLGIGLLCLLLTGCWDAKELEQVIYINTIGFDYQKGNIITYAQVINFGNLGKSEGGARMPEEVWVGRGIGRTADSSTDDLYPTAQQRISWAHIKGILISERALQHERFDELFDAYERYPEIRYETNLFATRDSVEEVLTARPILNISALYTRLINPRDIYHQFSVVAPINFREFTKQLQEPSSTLVIPYLKINDSRWKRNMKGHQVMELDGAGFIKNRTYKGTLDAKQAQGLRWVQKGSKRSSVYLMQGEKPVASLSLHEPKAKTTFRMQDGKPRFTVTIKASGTLVESIQQKSEQELTRMAARQVEQEVRRLYLAALKIQADALGLEERIYRKDPKLWMQLTQGRDLALDEKSLEKIEVKVSLKSTGKKKIKS